MEIALLQEWIWLGGIVGFKNNCLHMGPGPTGEVSSAGSIPKGVSEKTTENSERLSQQARPGFEPGISRLPALSNILQEKNP